MGAYWNAEDHWPVSRNRFSDDYNLLSGEMDREAIDRANTRFSLADAEIPSVFEWCAGLNYFERNVFKLRGKKRHENSKNIDDWFTAADRMLWYNTASLDIARRRYGFE